MKIAYLYSNTVGNHFSNHFEELKNGFEYNKIDCFQCPREVKYSIVKKYDALIFDCYHMHSKNIGYIPEITDKKVYDLKLGIITMDFWYDLLTIKMKLWCQRNRVKDFIIFRHSSGLQFFNKKFDLFKEAIEDKRIHKPTSFLEPNNACLDFEKSFLVPFTINKDIVMESDLMEKEYDICLGCSMSVWYPLRKRIVDVVNKSKKFKVIDPIWKAPSFNLLKERPKFNEYYQSTSKSWLTLATIGIGRISTRKHYEICALNSTCLGNHTNLEDHEIVKQNTISINDKMKDKEIIEIIDRTLKNKDNIKKMSELVRDRIRLDYDYRKIGLNFVVDFEKYLLK